MPPRRFYLVVCEGEATEPNYFRAIVRQLPRGMVDHVDIEGTGMNTLSLVDAAQRMVENRKRSHLPPYYHVWLVFDRDSFPASHFNETIDTVDKINHATKSAKNPVHWHCAWSNEAFELWYVLHFREQLGGNVSRQALQKMVEDEMRSQTDEKEFRYKKNDETMFNRLKPRTVSAIGRSKRALKRQLAEKGHVWSEMNPATRVHELVEDLLSYIP